MRWLVRSNSMRERSRHTHHPGPLPRKRGRSGSGLRLCVALLAAWPAAARADSFTPQQRAEIVRILRQALHDDPSILRDAIGALQQDEGERRESAARAALASRSRQLRDDPADPVAGNPHGDVTVVEFYDPRCPYCRAMRPVVARLLAADPGVRLVYKDIPVLGPDSRLDARALLAAQRQGGYLPMQAAEMAARRTPDRGVAAPAGGATSASMARAWCATWPTPRSRTGSAPTSASPRRSASTARRPS